MWSRERANLPRNFTFAQYQMNYTSVETESINFLEHRKLSLFLLIWTFCTRNCRSLDSLQM